LAKPDFAILFCDSNLQTQVGQTWVVVGSATKWPMKKAVSFSDCQIVDAGMPLFHKARGVELPVLITVGTVPLAGGIL
jgi:hypothetical protein